MRSLNLDQLRAFVAVVARGSFTAGPKLGSTQLLLENICVFKRALRPSVGQGVWGRARAKP